MFGYYAQLALRSLRRSPVLTALMVLSIAVGIGAAMTTLTVMHLLSGDPLPGRSQHIFYPQVDAVPEDKSRPNPPDKLDYTSAMDLWRAHRADRQTLVISSPIKLRAPDTGAPPLMTSMLSAHSDFFPMFNVPFAYGSAWSAEDDAKHARLAVISSDLNQKLFGGKNSVGRILHIRNADVRVVGVLKPWRPSPQYYTVAGGRFAQGDTASYYVKPQDVFVPFATGLDINDGHFPYFFCWGTPQTPGHLQNAPCVALQLWVQLDSAAKIADYRRFLAGYAAQQQTLGRIRRPENVRLSSLMTWLDFNHAVPSDVRLQTWVALAFLVICLFNTIGLLMAKFLQTARAAVARAVPESVLDQDELRERYFRSDRAMAWLLATVIAAMLLVTALGIVGLASFWVAQRTKQIGIRRALGATRVDILRYFQTENLLLTTAGIALGMLLAYAANGLLMKFFELSRLPLFYLPIGAVLPWLLGQLAVLGRPYAQPRSPLLLPLVVLESGAAYVRLLQQSGPAQLQAQQGVDRIDGAGHCLGHWRIDDHADGIPCAVRRPYPSEE